MGFEFQHEFNAKKRSTTAFTTSRPLLPLILAIDRAKSPKSHLYQGFVDLSRRKRRTKAEQKVTFASINNVFERSFFLYIHIICFPSTFRIQKIIKKSLIGALSRAFPLHDDN